MSSWGPAGGTVLQQPQETHTGQLRAHGAVSRDSGRHRRTVPSGLLCRSLSLCPLPCSVHGGRHRGLSRLTGRGQGLPREPAMPLGPKGGWMGWAEKRLAVRKKRRGRGAAKKKGRGEIKPQVTPHGLCVSRSVGHSKRGWRAGRGGAPPSAGGPHWGLPLEHVSVEPGRVTDLQCLWGLVAVTVCSPCPPTTCHRDTASPEPPSWSANSGSQQHPKFPPGPLGSRDLQVNAPRPNFPCLAKGCEGLDGF